MLLYKLKEMECVLEAKNHLISSQLTTVRSLKKALLKIDDKAEEIPVYSFDKLKVLLEDIISRKLIEDEIILLKKIMKK